VGSWDGAGGVLEVGVASGIRIGSRGIAKIVRIVKLGQKGIRHTEWG